MASALVRSIMSKLLDAVTATGAGAAFSVPEKPTGGQFGAFTWQIIITGAPTSITVNLEGSLDGTNWFQLDTYTGSANAMQHVVNKPVAYLRGNLVTLTGGSSPTVTVQALVGG